MRAPRFWNQPSGFLARKLIWLLLPFSWVYGAITARRMAKPGQRMAVPVICVGNLTAGGAGKTPTVLKLAELLQAQGRNPFVLSRGYGGSARAPTRIHACDAEGNYVSLVFFGRNGGWARKQLSKPWGSSMH